MLQERKRGGTKSAKAEGCGLTARISEPRLAAQNPHPFLPPQSTQNRRVLGTPVAERMGYKRPPRAEPRFVPAAARSWTHGCTGWLARERRSH
jgi:hypothetical protein